MYNYKKDIIIVYHIPVDDLTRQQSHDKLHDMVKYYTTGEFFREYFFQKLILVKKLILKL
jgi:hypothetical protein